MKEEFLHYVWKYKLFSLKKLKGTKSEEIIIIKSGIQNSNSGPDFLNAHLLIDGQKWVGNVEIHLKSSDWYCHNHQEDVSYDAVILHVVLEEDVEVFMKDNKSIPTLALKNKIDSNLLKNYKGLFANSEKWIPCEKDIGHIDSFLLNNWLERLYIERLEEKSILIKQLLLKTNNDYEAVLFQLLCKNFGMKVNADAFLLLSQSIDFSIIRKESYNESTFSALLFGQAGFLNKNIEDVYYKALQKEYMYLKHKYKLQEVNNNLFQFFRMRPNNFPTIRIAQLVALYFNIQNLFSKLMDMDRLEEIYLLLSVDVSEYWKNHYTFEKESKKTSKKVTKSFVVLLVINTIIPLRFVYRKGMGTRNDMSFMNLLRQLPPEKNNIICKFNEYGIGAKTAFESQGLLQLKNNYCNKNECLKCSIGNFLLKNNE